VRDWDLVSDFCRWKSSFPSTIVEEAVFSPRHILVMLVESQMAIVVGVCAALYSYILSVFMSASVPVPCCLYYNDFVV
jgi:hypothetical protein